MSDPTVIRVDPRYPGIWDDVKPYLAEALERGHGDRDWSMDDIQQAAIEGRVQLWALVNGRLFGAAVTCESFYPRRKVVEILLLGTDRGAEEHWRQCLDQFSQIAKAYGADCLSGTGRPGWGRKLGARERRVWEIDL